MLTNFHTKYLHISKYLHMAVIHSLVTYSVRLAAGTPLDVAWEEPEVGKDELLAMG